MRWLQMLRLVVAAGLLLGLAHAAMYAIAGPRAPKAVEQEARGAAGTHEPATGEPGAPAASEPGGEEVETSRLYAFIYERGPVQHAILGVAAFALVLLYWRQRGYVENAMQLRRYEAKRGNPPGPLAEALRKVGRSNADHGAAAARSQVDRFHDEQLKTVQQDYDLVRFAVGSLPALGLLGTMLGLSDALYYAFSKGLFGDAEVKAFVAGLSTALDTTVLAMLCAAPLFAWTALLVWQQSRLVDRYVDFLRRHFGLTDAPEGDKGVYAIYAELCRLTKQIGQDAKVMFAEMLNSSATALRETLGEAVQEHLAQHHQSQLETAHAHDRQIAMHVNAAAQAILQALEKQNRELAEQLAEAVKQDRGEVLEDTRAVREEVVRSFRATAQAIRDLSDRLGEQLPQTVSHALADSLAQATESADQRHASLADRMTRQMGRLESALRNRTPEEVIIRYRENGALHRGA